MVEITPRLQDAVYKASGDALDEHEVDAIIAAVAPLIEAQARGEMERLQNAALAVLNQWDTPNWKLTEPTGKFMADLRAAYKASVDKVNRSTDKEMALSPRPVSEKEDAS